MSPSTHTYAVLFVTDQTFEEIRKKLESAGYTDVFHVGQYGEIVIDMHGLALSKTTPPAPPTRGKRA